jgi:hypothetical protein
MSNSEEEKEEEDPIRTQMERKARVETLDWFYMLALRKELLKSVQDS